MNQKKLILDHLKTHGTITPKEALQLCGCYRLAARIDELKNEGEPIRTEIVKSPNGKRFAKYVYADLSQMDFIGIGA